MHFGQTQQKLGPRALGALVVLTLLPRIIWALLVRVHPVSDSMVYDMLARSLANGIGYYWHPGNPTAHWPVGTSFVYSVVYRLCGFSYVPVVVLNLLVALATLGLLVYLGRQWLGRRATIGAAIVYALWPMQIEFTTVLASEPISNLLNLATLAVWERRGLGNWLRWTLIGLLVAASSYIRPTALLLPFVLAILSLIRGIHWRELAPRLALACLILALCIAPWSMRNTHLFGRFVLLSTNGGANLWEGNNPTGSGVTQEFPPEAMRMQEADRDVYLGRIAKDYIAQYPGRFLIRSLNKARWTYDHETIGVHWNLVSLTDQYGDHTVRLLKLASDLYWFIVLALSLAGLGLWLRLVSVREALSSPMIVLWAYFLVTQAVIVAQDRYHYPVVPFIALFAGFALARLERWRHKKAQS